MEAYRFAAVRLRCEGVRVEVIARSFGVTAKAVYEWLGKQRIGGLQSLRARKAPGAVPALSEAQFRKLLALLRKPATELGYNSDLWSGPRVRHLIKHRLGVEYHPKHMPRFLKRLGLHLVFPERRALEQDPAEVRRWKEERLPEILRYARKHRALVFYADESLVSLIPHIGKTWAFPDMHPVAYVSGQRGQHVGVTGAVNEQGRLCFELTGEEERFTARVFLRFIRKLHRQCAPRSVVLIVDGAPVHKAKIIKAYAEDNQRWLRLEYLPAYSPELNPTEDSWGFLKTKTLNACTASNKTELRERVSQGMGNLKKDKARVASFFVAKK
jgi:transposase